MGGRDGLQRRVSPKGRGDGVRRHEEAPQGGPRPVGSRERLEVGVPDLDLAAGAVGVDQRVVAPWRESAYRRPEGGDPRRALLGRLRCAARAFGDQRLVPRRSGGQGQGGAAPWPCRRDGEAADEGQQPQQTAKRLQQTAKSQPLRPTAFAASRDARLTSPRRSTPPSFPPPAKLVQTAAQAAARRAPSKLAQAAARRVAPTMRGSVSAAATAATSQGGGKVSEY